eukprot:CAMPEP_0179059590 /NCGR_PEP_ID=MMETSP0796-20121207/25431_1 /TAXON_ID=73915 /ORGANISM="Pyrodinium bahamense, Strain pbaha01" /LENGTH=52 /DNA_ID=CAMNT_0020756351 /DNA_START=138 /DNA_END=296 /DNA_ORIENTATION=+
MGDAGSCPPQSMRHGQPTSALTGGAAAKGTGKPMRRARKLAKSPNGDWRAKI